MLGDLQCHKNFKKLQIKLIKVINNSDIDEFSIKQVVPYNYLNNISKMERLFDYMQIKLTEIIKENINTVKVPESVLLL